MKINIQLQAFTLLLLVNSIYAVFSRDCDVANGTLNLSIYAHWPFELDCEHLIKIWQENNRTISDFTCEIWNGTDQVLSPIVEFTSAEETHLFEAKLMINGTLCISGGVSVDVVPFPNVTCEGFLQKSVDSAAIVHNQATIGDPATLSCKPFNDRNKIIPSDMNRTDFRTTWMINCEKDRGATYRPNAVIYNNPNTEAYPDDLRIASVECVDAGQFVCSVTYKERTLFVAAQSLCVKKNVEDEQPSITCTTNELVARGETTHIDCEGILPNGITNSDEFEIKWTKDGQTVCSTSIFNRTSNADGKVTCLVRGNNDSLICVKDGRIPGTDPCQSERKKVNVEMEIRSTGSFDYGSYEVVIEHKGSISSSNVEVTEDLVPVYQKLVAILSVALVFVLSMVILTTIYNKYELYIKLQCIKFRGYYKQTGEWAFLSYYYERPDEGNDMGAFRDIESIVPVVQASTNVYDPAIEADVQDRIGMYIHAIERSHSAIMILSSRYLEEEDTFQAELAFNNLMTQRIRLVFILTGNVEQQLRNRSEEAWKRIYMAIKVFGAFVWFDGGEGALQKYIEERMPPPPDDEMALIMR